MLGLLVAFLLATAGVSLAYRFSPAAKVKARIAEVLSPFEELDSEIQRLHQSLQSEIDLLTSQYIQRIHTIRLQAIPVDELKKYATGMRLQALKDVGVRTVFDLQGWNEYRVSQVRGVGPKSAFAIVQSVAAATAAAKAVPIPNPSLPFSEDIERQLMQALYRQRWFQVHIAEQATAFAVTVRSHQCTRDAILAKSTFAHWLWKFGSNATIRRSLEQGSSLIRALEDQNLGSTKQVLSQLLAECKAICANRIPVESITKDFNDERTFYDSYLANRLGAANNTPPRQTPVRPSSSNPPAVTPRQPEILFSVSVGSTSSSAVTEFALPSPPRPVELSDLRWLKKEEAIQIQGHNLVHGFIYVGKGINDEQHYAVNPRLPATSGNLSSAEEGGYCSNYSYLSPERRSLYLAWLADGARSPSESGFGMLYFYGIERRLIDLLQGRASDPSGTEQQQLLLEVNRVGDLFKDKPGSVTQCCLRLSDFAVACALDKTPLPELPKEWVRTWELPFIVRYGIGWFMKDSRPIPLEWALRWAYVEPTIYLRTPALRCTQEFEAAFADVYRDKFGDGLVIPANKTKLKLTYQPGWPMQFGREIRHELSGIPDVAAVSNPQQVLKNLVEEATAKIDVYSRYLRRYPAKSGTFEAYLNLPLHLWPSTATDRWQQFLNSFVEPVQPILLEVLLRELGYVGDPGSARLSEIATNLNRALVGFEPDILAGARRPKSADPVTVFPLTSQFAVDRTTTDYKKASLIISLSACVALADGHATEDEASAVEGMVASWEHLHNDLRTRLRAQYRLQIRKGVSLASLKSHLANLTPDGRAQLAGALCSLAAADGNIAAAEVRLLEQIYRALELDPKLLYSHLHVGTQQAKLPDAQRTSMPSGTSAYTVDAARLATLRQETDQVSALLAEVFVEGEPECSSEPDATSPDSPPSPVSDDILLPGLDSKYQRFLADLLRKPSWTRQELQSLAAQSQIMLNGALERINEASFELVGEAITEGDDPVYVQQSILETAK